MSSHSIRNPVLRRLIAQRRLRVATFHDISADESSFTRGLGVTMAPDVFAQRIAFLARNYTPIGLDDVIAAGRGAALPKGALLITFDDAYASVAHHAAPVLEHHDIQSVFFVNAGFVDGRALAIDNLVTHAANEAGLSLLDQAARMTGTRRAPFQGIADVIQTHAGRVDRVELARFRDAIVELLGHDPLERAIAAHLYITTAELRSLPRQGIEIGNHTYSHARCRNLEADERVDQVAGGRTALEELGDHVVRSFSVPYGEAADLDPVRPEAHESGHDVLFLNQSRANPRHVDLGRLDRSSLAAETDRGTIAELEVKPRLRVARDRLQRIGR